MDSSDLSCFLLHGTHEPSDQQVLQPCPTQQRNLIQQEAPTDLTARQSRIHRGMICGKVSSSRFLSVQARKQHLAITWWDCLYGGQWRTIVYVWPIYKPSRHFSAQQYPCQVYSLCLCIGIPPLAVNRIYCLCCRPIIRFCDHLPSASRTSLLSTFC